MLSFLHFYFHIFKWKVITRPSNETTDFSLVMYSGLLQGFCLHKLRPFFTFDCKPPSNQDFALHFFLFDNPFHLNVCHNMEEKIYLRYFCYIATLTLSSIQCGLSDVIRKGKSFQGKSKLQHFDEI